MREGRLEATLAVLQAHRVSFNETAQRHGMAVTEAQVSALHARLCVDSFQGLAMHRDACVAKLPRALTRPYGQLTVGSFDRVVDAQFVLGGGLLIADVANGMPRRTTGASETQQRLGAWLAAIKPLVRDLNEAAASSPTVHRALHRVGVRRRCAPCRVRRAADGPVVVVHTASTPTARRAASALTHSYLPRALPPRAHDQTL